MNGYGTSVKSDVTNKFVFSYDYTKILPSSTEILIYIYPSSVLYKAKCRIHE